MYKKSELLGIIGTLVIHGIIVFLLLYKPPMYDKTGAVPDAPKSKPIEVRLIPKDQPVSPTTQLKNDTPAKASYPTDGRICNGKDKLYKGAGIIYNPGSGLIQYAPEYYPGYIAGMRVGDYISNPEMPIVDGYIDFEVMRNYNMLRFRVKVDNICFNEE